MDRVLKKSSIVSKSKTALATALLLGSITLTALPAVTVYAGFDSWAQITQSGKEKDIIEIGNALMAAGFNYESTIGILANINTESGFEVQMEENAATVTSQGAGFGLIQWTGGRRTALENYVKEKHGGKMTLAAQVDFLKYEMQTSHANNMENNYVTGQLNSYGLKLEGELPGSWEGFMKIKSYKDATALFMACMEIPGIPHWDQRAAIADELYNNLKGKLNGKPSSDSGSEGKKDSGVNANDIVEDSIPEETALLGMRKRSYLADKQTKLEWSDGSSLSVSEAYNVQSMKTTIKENVSFKLVDFIRNTVAFIGILFFLWGILFIIAYVFDTNNIFFKVSLVSLMTFGRHTVHSLQDSSERRVSRSAVTKLVIYSWVGGFFLVGGAVYGVIDFLYTILRGIFKF